LPHLSPLPNLPSSDIPRSPTYLAAVTLLKEKYEAACLFLADGSFETHRVQFHKHAILETAIPVLYALETTLEEEKVSTEWIEAMGTKFGLVISQIVSAERNA